jgi:hypothetical protein
LTDFPRSFPRIPAVFGAAGEVRRRSHRARRRGILTETPHRRQGQRETIAMAPKPAPFVSLSREEMAARRPMMRASRFGQATKNRPEHVSGPACRQAMPAKAI